MFSRPLTNVRLQSRSSMLTSPICWNGLSTALRFIRKIIRAYADTTNPPNLHQILNVGHEIFYCWLPIPAVDISDIGTKVHADHSAFIGDGAALPIIEIAFEELRGAGIPARSVAVDDRRLAGFHRLQERRRTAQMTSVHSHTQFVRSFDGLVGMRC